MAVSPGEPLGGAARRARSHQGGGSSAAVSSSGHSSRPNTPRGGAYSSLALGDKPFHTCAAPSLSSSGGGGGPPARGALVVGAIVLLCVLGLIASMYSGGSSAALVGGAFGFMSNGESRSELRARVRELERTAADAVAAAAAAADAARARAPPVPCTSGAVPPRQRAGQRPLLVAAEPPVNVTLLIAAAAAANDTRLERIGRLLEQHREVLREARAGSSGGSSTTSSRKPAAVASLRTPLNVTAARAAYATAIDAAMREAAFATLRRGGGASAAAARDGGASYPEYDFDAASSAAGGAAAALAAEMIREALGAVNDYAIEVSKARDGEPVLVPCAATADPTLPSVIPAGQRVLIAANLRNSEAIMPNFLLNVLRLASAQGGVTNDESSADVAKTEHEGEVVVTEGEMEESGDDVTSSSGVFLAVYESGSNDDDATGRWLYMLRMLLEPIGVPSNITAGGPLKRAAGQERIDFLAAARNALLPPVGPPATALATAAGATAGISTATVAAAGSQQASAKLFQADDVLFINDVLWCAGDAMRLLLVEADFAAAVDFGWVDDNSSPNHHAKRRRLMGAEEEGASAAGVGGKVSGSNGEEGGQAAAPAGGFTKTGAAAQTAAAIQKQQQQQVMRSRKHLVDVTPGSKLAAAPPAAAPATAAAAAGTSSSGGGGSVGKSVSGVGGDGASKTEGKRAKQLALAAAAAAAAARAAADAAAAPAMPAPPLPKQKGGGGAAASASQPGGKPPAEKKVERLTYKAVVHAAEVLRGDPDSREVAVRVPLYDVWVMRDITGQRPKWSAPYGHDRTTTRAFARGLPFPVYCGWGGMARVAAQPFADGLRFRKHMDGECQASECSLLCDDLHRMGYRRVVMDPSARTAYDMPTAWTLHSGAFDLQALAGLGHAPWSHVAERQEASRALAAAAAAAALHKTLDAQAAAAAATAGNSTGGGGFGNGTDGSGTRLASLVATPLVTPQPPTPVHWSLGGPIDWDSVEALPRYSEVDCCHKGEGATQELVTFEYCRPSDILHRNYTQRFFEQCGLRSQHAPPARAPGPVVPLVFAAGPSAADLADAPLSDAQAPGASLARGDGKEGAAAPAVAAAAAAPAVAGAKAADSSSPPAQALAASPAAPAAAGQSDAAAAAAPVEPRPAGLTYVTARARHPDGTWAEVLTASCPL